MIKIGLSGNRYSGKDVVARLFEQIKIPVFDADIVLKFILNYNYEINYKIRRSFGDAFSAPGDLLDVRKFKERKQFDDLLDMVEFELFSAYETFNKKNSKSIYTIFHSSILFEREWNKSMDFNINVFSTKDERQFRCNMKTGLEEYKVKQLIESEFDDLIKNSLSNFVIHNYPSAIPPFGDVCEQVNKIDQKIVDDFLRVKQSDIFRDFV